MIIWGVGWGCWGEGGGLWGGTVGVGLCGGMQWCFGGCWDGGSGAVGVGFSSLVSMSLGSGLGTWYCP